MLAPYLAVLRMRSVGPAMAAALAWGVGAGMIPVALLLFVRESAGSFGDASVALAAYAASAGISAPLRARAVDRRGIPAVTRALATANAAALLCVLALGEADAPIGVLALLAAAAGTATPPVVPALRALLSVAVPPSQRRQAYALLSILQEVAFVVGPSLAGLLLLLASAGAALAVAVGVGLAGALAFAGVRAPAREPPLRGVSRPPAIHSSGLQVLLGMSVLFGVAFGSLDVAAPAFAASRDSPAMAGPLLGALAFGVGTGSLLFGLRASHSPVGPTLPRLTVLAAAGLALLVLADSVAALLVLMGVAGLGLGPALTSLSAALDEVVPGGTTAEATAWTMSLFAAGSAVGAVVCGSVFDSEGDRAALALAAGAIAAAGIVALTGPLSRPAPHLPSRGRS